MRAGARSPATRPSPRRSRRHASPQPRSTASWRPRGRPTTSPALSVGQPFALATRPRGPAPRLHLRDRRAAHAARLPRGRDAARRASLTRQLRDPGGAVVRRRSPRASSAPSPTPARRTSSPSTWPTSSPGTWTSTPRSRGATRSAWRSRSSTLDGRFARYGRILAAEFVRGDRACCRPSASTAQRVRRLLRARRHAAAQGLPALAPQVLADQLALQPARASIPILNITRPHYGVDYAAPIGHARCSPRRNGVVALRGLARTATARRCACATPTASRRSTATCRGSTCGPGSASTQGDARSAPWA